MRRDRKYYVTHGNNAMKYETAQPKKFTGKRHLKVIRTKKAKTKKIAIANFIGLFAICATFFVVGGNLKAKADMNNNIKALSNAQLKLDKLVSENDAIQNSINTHVDLNTIYDDAIHRLGMVNAGNNQIILYDKTDNEYVRQNNEQNK